MPCVRDRPVLSNDRGPRVVPATRCTARAGGAAGCGLAATASRSEHNHTARQTLARHRGL